MTFKKYKTFSVLLYGYITTSGNLKMRNCVEARRLQGGVFLHNFDFSNLHVDSISVLTAGQKRYHGTENNVAGQKSISRDVSFLCTLVIALIKALVCDKMFHISFTVYHIEL